MTARALLLAGCAVLIAAPASAGVGGFRLPETPTPTPTSTIVGPVDPDRPVLRPSPAPTPRRTVAVPTATPTPTPAPSPTLPAARPTPRATPGARTSSATPSPSPTPAAPATTSADPASGTPTALPTTFPTAAAPPTVAPPPPAEANDDEGGLPWPWIAGFGLLVALLGGGWYWLRQRMLPGGTVLIVPEIEKPRVPAPRTDAAPASPPATLPQPGFVTAPAPARAPALGPAPAPAAPQAFSQAQADHPLHITITPVKLTQTLMNATLSYRLALANKGTRPLDGLAVAADLVGAHASVPRETLLAGPLTDLPERHTAPTLAPGETVELKGEMRLPLAQAMAMKQGSAVIFVPLARFRATSAGEEPRCFTVVIGQPGPRGGIQPMRLDQGPRSIDGLTGRAF
jgi:hypothetical protein